MSKSETVYVLSITHRHGTDIGVYRTPEGADDALYAYVVMWWDDLKERAGCSAKLPKKRQDAIDLYFEEMMDTESYELETRPLLP